MEFPEHEKMKKIAELSNQIGEFIDWLHEERKIKFYEYDDFEYEWNPCYTRTEDLLAKYFEIDLDIIEKEKREMLSILRMANDVPASEDK